MKLVTSTAIPFVDYLVLDDGDPHLVANECVACGARFFDRRNACAACFGTDFRQVRVPDEGTLRSFTIVAFAAPGVDVPFVAGLVDCGGTSVRGNIVNCPPDPDHVTVIATGAFPEAVVDHCTTITTRDPWLILTGLRLIHEKNHD